VFGNNVDTDQIIQGRYLTLLDYTEMAKHAFEIPRPEFASAVRKNDIIIAGKNFGGGSTREEAPQILVKSGVGLFYRNGFNVGLPLMTVPKVTSVVRDGMKITVDLSEGALRVDETGEVLKGDALPQMMLDLLRAGGAVPWFRQQK
jgi:3-isopropylmalate/(R)-2-methylmalate dehydratase small subunit